MTVLDFFHTIYFLNTLPTRVVQFLLPKHAQAQQTRTGWGRILQLYKERNTNMTLEKILVAKMKKKLFPEVIGEKEFENAVKYQSTRPKITFLKNTH